MPASITTTRSIRRPYRAIRAIVALVRAPARIIVVALTLAALVASSLCGFAVHPEAVLPASSNRPEILVDLWLPEGTILRGNRARRPRRLKQRLLQDDRT